MIMSNVAYSRAQHMFFILPFWLLASPFVTVHALNGPIGDDGSKVVASSNINSKSKQSEFDIDRLGHPPSFSRSSKDSGISSDCDYCDDRGDSSASPGADQMRTDLLDELDFQDHDYADEPEFSFRKSFLEEEIPAQGKEAMYEAYNQLHTLAQAYAKPFDAPAVVVVGHQSSGKSALIEALMGFQFNQVGGGTKTRRPVALRMQYNPDCKAPRWFLVGDDGVERPTALKDVQDYIERENRRLERDPMRSFDPREINLRMEYKYCPNMILIDTPGLISAPKVPRGRTGAGSALAQQRALQASAKEAEALVVEKMKVEDYIILCVEDTNDWKHGSTREVVQKADADLSRTVIVNTKFDTKLPQFGTPSDVEDFLRAQILDRISPHRLGGPFYTSVPSGRVGRANIALRDSGDFLYGSDEAFVHSCKEAEANDRGSVLNRLKRMKWSNEVTSAAMTSKIGLGRLRTFLEQRVDECYRKNVNKIIPMLQAEHSAAERRLKAVEKELEALSVERLKAGADAFCDEFCTYLKKVIHGSITAPSSIFGETLSQESAAAGSFHNMKNCPMAVSDRTWERLVESEVGNKNHRLYGGSQYHRSLREFTLASKCLRTPIITEDEIANAAGVGEVHDGVNFLQASCVIAIEKAQQSFEPMLNTLLFRMTHVMSRLFPITEYMLRESRDRGKIINFRFPGKQESGTTLEDVEQAMDISQNPQFREVIRTIFEEFVEKCANSVMVKCRDDLKALTKYVTWNLDQRGSGALSRALPDQTSVFAVYQVAVKKQQVIEGNTDSPNINANNQNQNKNNKKKGSKDGKSTDLGVLTPVDPPPPDNRMAMANSHSSGAVDRDYHNLLQIMEEVASSRHANRTNIVVGGLVQHIVAHWRDQFCRSVTTKYNCYFLLPFVDDLHRYFRNELQKMYSGDGDSLCDFFDLTVARRALELHRDELVSECMANKQLQDKFQLCSRMMRKQHNLDSGPSQIPATAMLPKSRSSEYSN